MKWHNEIQINASIDQVWEVLTNEVYTEKIMPKLVASRLVEENKAENIKVYEDTYREGKRDETYLLTLKLLKDTATEKEQTFHFVIANTIESNGRYLLTKVDETTTHFVYTGENTGANFMGKVMMKMARLFGNDKESVQYLQRVKETAENI